MVLEPEGIQVVRTESLLLRLLKAVLIPTTIKYRLFPGNCLFSTSFDIGAPFIKDSCADLAAANSISKLEMVLSNVLKLNKNVLKPEKFSKILNLDH